MSSTYDWATGTLQGVVNLLFTANIKILATPDGGTPGSPNGANPGSLPDAQAAVIHSDGLIADALMYDAILAGPAGVIAPFAVNGTVLASLPDTDLTKVVVGYYSCKMVAKILNEHRMLQSVIAQPRAAVDQLMEYWYNEVVEWLAGASNGMNAVRLDRSQPHQENARGSVSAMVKLPTMYPGVPVRPLAYTTRKFSSSNPQNPGIVQ